jgi:putative ABC transport system permease protein
MTKDLLWGFRWLRNHPGFTIAVVAILALGIGANTAIFSIVDAVLLRPLPYPSASRLVRIEESSAKKFINRIPARDLEIWKTRSDLFELAVGHSRDDVTIYGAGEPDQVVSRRSTPGLFTLLGARAELGRPLSDADHEVLLSDRLWRRRFHADPRVLGRAINISDESYTIVGVMPPEFDFPYADVELWLPMRVTPAAGQGVQSVVARIREGLSVAQVQSAMEVLARQWEREDPQGKAGLQVTVSAYRDDIGGKFEQTLLFVLISVGLVLLIACADVGSLLLSRAVQRQREMAIRASLGAAFGRLLRQLLAESLLLAAAGSAAGIAVAHYTVVLLTRQLAAMPVLLPHVQRVAINGRVLLFNAALCLLLALIISIAPVFLALRTDLQDVLRSGHRGSGSRGASRLFSALIACEAAFAFLLLVGSGLMIRSLVRLQQADHGIRAENVLTMRLPIGSLTQTSPRGKYETKPRQREYYRAVIERLQKVPGVKAAAIVNNLPLSGVNTSTVLEGPGMDPIPLPTRTISSQYFAVMGTPLVSGRYFLESDITGAPRVAIVNEYLANQLFPGRDPIGQKLPGAKPEEGATIVGVVRNSPQQSYETPPKGELYLPYQQVIFGVFLSTAVVRTAGDPLALAGALCKEVWQVDPNQPIVKVEAMTDVIANSIWRPRFSAWLFSVLGGLALLLTSAGVYSVVAYTTTLRAREVGIRVALGATPRDVIAVIVRGAMLPLLAGLTVSAVAAIFLSRLLGAILYEIKSSDPVTYLSAAAILLVIGGVASIRPAWKAAAGDPVAALRSE